MTINRLLRIDSRWSERLRIAEKPGLVRTLAAILAHSGDSWFWLLGLALGWWFGNAYWKAWSLKLMGPILLTAFLVMALKFTFRRRRPEGDWGAIYRNTDPHSFPSGHAARAVLVAALVSAWGPLWLAVLLVIWAPLVGLARVAMGVHYLSDVVGGGLLGLFMSVLVLVFVF